MHGAPPRRRWRVPCYVLREMVRSGTVLRNGPITSSRARRLMGCGNVAAALGLCASLVGCNTAGFKRVFMSLDEQGNRKRTAFYTDTTAIYCVGELVSGRADVTVQSNINANTIYDPSSDQLVSAAGISWLGESAPGKTEGTFVSFELVKPAAAEGSSEKGPYPVGTFSCELAIDGEPEGIIDFTIEFPPCPVLPPTAGQFCAGWVHAASRCDGAGARSCICDAISGTWQCD